MPNRALALFALLLLAIGLSQAAILAAILFTFVVSSLLHVDSWNVAVGVSILRSLLFTVLLFVAARTVFKALVPHARGASDSKDPRFPVFGAICLVMVSAWAEYMARTDTEELLVPGVSLVSLLSLPLLSWLLRSEVKRREG